MPAFYLDHNVARRVALLLRTAGHHAATTRDLGGERNGDEMQLLVAASRGFTLVTHDDDFLRIHRNWARRSHILQTITAHAGILLIPAFPIWDAERTAREVEAFLHPRPPLEGVLYAWAKDGWRQW